MSAKATILMIVSIFALSAFVTGCGDDTTSPQITIEDEAPMLPPANVALSPKGSAVEISWSANTQSHLAGYNVYRQNIKSSSSTRLTDTPTTSNSYRDGSVVEGATYDYWVTSVSKSGKESTFSTVQITVPVTSSNDRDKRNPSTP